MPGLADGWSMALVETLVQASVRGGLVVLVVWVVCRQVGALRASTRAFLWWTAAVALLVAMLPLPAIPLPVLPPAPAAAVVPSNASDDARSPRGIAAIGRAAPGSTEWQATALASPAPDASSRADAPEPAWPPVLAAFWLSGLAFALARVLGAHRRMRGVIGRSSPADAATHALAARTAAALGMSEVPPVRTSHEIRSPLVAGVRRPVILLPAGATTWPSQDLAMALCHELVHVQRRDLLLGWVPLLAERLLFFHPLAHLAAREYAIAREAACDAGVLRTLAVEPQEYGRLLMRIGIVRRRPAAATSGAATSPRVLRRRLEMLNDHTFRQATRGGVWILAVVLCLAVLPVRFVSAVDGSTDRVAFTPVPVPLTVAPEVSPLQSAAPILMAAPPAAVQDQAPNAPVPRPDAPAASEQAPVPPGAQAGLSPADSAPEDDFTEWVRRTQQALLREIAGTMRRDERRDGLAQQPPEVPATRDDDRDASLADQLVPLQEMAQRLQQMRGNSWDQNRQAVIPRELDTIVERLQALERMLADPARWWGGWWSDPAVRDDRARLEQQMRVLQQQREALARIQDGFARARESLARQQEEVARQQEELRERQRALDEQLDAARGAN